MNLEKIAKVMGWRWRGGRWEDALTVSMTFQDGTLTDYATGSLVKKLNEWGWDVTYTDYGTWDITHPATNRGFEDEHLGKVFLLALKQQEGGE